MDCQNRVKLAYKIRGELIKAFERKKKKKPTLVYQIITKNNGNDSKSLNDGSVVHEELVEIAEVDDDFGEEITEQIYVDETKHEIDDEEFFNESELITDDQHVDEPLDAVSFLLEKKELFTSDSPPGSKKGRRCHKCEVCEKSFMRKSNLVDHLRLHANVR